MASLENVEAIIWYQARRLVSDDQLARTTAMDAIKVAIRAYAEDAAGGIIRRRRSALRADLESSYPGRPSP
jgi:hypothetical protein